MKSKTHSKASRKASQSRGERSSTIASATVQSGQGQSHFLYQQIKLAVDVHADFLMVSRQLDNATPQPPQKMSREQYLAFAAKQVKLAQEVYSCYEAGAFGYGLHRELKALGVKNMVIRPLKLDSAGKQTKTDRTDTREMAVRLDRQVAGHSKALPVIHVPTIERELDRGDTRQRESFKRDLNRYRSRGRSLLLYWGLRIKGNWYRDIQWPDVLKQIGQAHPEKMAERIVAQLARIRTLALMVEKQLTELTVQLLAEKRRTLIQAQKAASGAAAADQAGKPVKIRRPRGIGLLSATKMAAEVGDWSQFSNRRQVASYTGLCPGVDGSGGKFTGLGINKCGNRRLRAELVEIAWLLTRYQPHYRPVAKWRWAWSGKNGVLKKKAIVAIARQLAIDLWRIATGRSTPEKLGLAMVLD